MTALAALRGQAPTGAPEAELWLGDHPTSPAHVVATGESLIDWGARHPERLGGTGLPFLLKVLAAERPLSIQAHPTREQAQRGFERENAAGVPLDSPKRNFRDANHKPEIIIALTPFSALCGVRPAVHRAEIVEALVALAIPGAHELRAQLEGGVEAAMSWLLSHGAGVDDLVTAVSNDIAPTGNPLVDSALTVARGLSRDFPGDPGIAVSLLLNHVDLEPGEALFLPAGNIHAYLHGLGIEVMATSDNVLRGGLTSKHVDVPELLDVVDSRDLAEPRLVPTVDGPRRVFAPATDDFAVTEVTAAGTVELALTGPAIAIVTDGDVTFAADTDVAAHRGQSFFLEAGETLREIAGNGRVFLAHRP